MKLSAYYNGVYSDAKEVKVGLDDRSVFFGDGVYDVIFGAHAKTYQLYEHLRRLRKNASAVGLSFCEEIPHIVGKLAEMSEYEFYSVYVQLSRSSAERTHAPDVPEKTNVLITLTEAHATEISAPVRAITKEDIRYRMCDVKTLNLLPAVLASIEAKNAGCDEAIFIRDGFVTEGAKSNVFILKDNMLITHPLTRDILPGITRQNLIRLAKDIGIPCIEEKFPYNSLFDADEIIITSTTKFARRVEMIDGIKCGCKAREVFSNLERNMHRDMLCSIC